MNEIELSKSKTVIKPLPSGDAGEICLDNRTVFRDELLTLNKKFGFNNQ
jgi:hypothetical protein